MDGAKRGAGLISSIAESSGANGFPWPAPSFHSSNGITGYWLWVLIQAHLHLPSLLPSFYLL